MIIKALQTQIKNAKTFKVSGLKNYSGVVEYYPEELVITVKSGTLTSKIKALLTSNGQGLDFALQDGTIGANYATGVSGISDSVLGIQMIDGSGNLLNFGGRVMKNVAGYDVARLLVGSNGAFGVITEISFKVLPLHYLKANYATKTNNHNNQDLIKKLKAVFDPRQIFI